jgi:hypothetical protein
LFFGIGVVAVLVGLAIWAAGRLLSPPAETQQVRFTAPSISEVLAATDRPGPSGLGSTAEPGISSSAAAPLPDAFPAPTVAGAANVRIMILALERTFVRVTVDGKEAFNGRVAPSSSYPFEGEARSRS